MKTSPNQIRKMKKEEKEQTECKGLYFRAYVNNFRDKYGNYHQNTKFSLLKRKSCPGCGECQWLEEEFLEGYVYNNESFFKERILKGKVYKLQVVNYSEYYDGVNTEIDYDIEMRKVREDC